MATIANYEKELNCLREFKAVKEDETRENIEQSKIKWVCKICGYVHYGDNPPEQCPVCGVPKEQFKRE